MSGFLRSFLDFNHLQPHHLTPNTVTLLSAFVTACEGYIGILPTLKLWGAFFYGKLGTSAKDTASERVRFVAVRRPVKRNAFPVIKLSQSVKRWQQSYFYVENVDPAVDFINLPAYEAGPPTGLRPNWATSQSRCRRTRQPLSADSGCSRSRRASWPPTSLFPSSSVGSSRSRAALIRSSGWADTTTRAGCARRECRLLMSRGW